MKHDDLLYVTSGRIKLKENKMKKVILVVLLSVVLSTATFAQIPGRAAVTKSDTPAWNLSHGDTIWLWLCVPCWKVFS
jgi:quercetin dioxygenase-like cupin family protein